jgi:hypothetical protein
MQEDYCHSGRRLTSLITKMRNWNFSVKQFVKHFNKKVQILICKYPCIQSIQILLLECAVRHWSYCNTEVKHTFWYCSLVLCCLPVHNCWPSIN